MLLNDPNIDAVYIPLPNHLNREWTIRAAKAGKHVLCEKPAALLVKELHEMVDACKENKVIFMEAFAFRCHPEWKRIKDLLDSNVVGEIKNVHASFSIFVDSPNDFRLNPQMGGGVLNDLGSYCIHGIRFIMGDEPTRILAMSQLAHDQIIDLSLVATMEFPGGRLGSLYCTFQGEYNQKIEITGTEGFMSICWPFRHPVITIQKGGKTQTEMYHIQINSYTEQIEHFCTCILENNTPIYSPDESIANMTVVDKVRANFSEVSGEKI